MTPTYDIFISYRREGADQADRIYTRLQALGYRVFMDVEALNSGKFNEQLLAVISQCKDFLLILPPNALDRCSKPDGTPDEQDWVRREVMCALEHKKNIIPIMLTGFEWPDPMPKGMEDLCMYQAITPLPNTYYDMQIKKLQGYLKSKAHFKTRRKWFIGLGITAFVIALLLLFTHLTYIPAAKQLGENLTLQASYMHELLHINKVLYSDWEKFVADYTQSERSAEDKAEALASFNQLMSIQQRSAQQIWKNIEEQPLYVSKLHLPLFAFHGIDAGDLLIVNNYVRDAFDSFEEQLNTYKIIIDSNNYFKVLLSGVKVSSEYLNSYINTFYYAYLSIMSHLPNDVLESYYGIAPKWIDYPNVGVGLPDNEYERLVNVENENLQQQHKLFDMLWKQTDAELDGIRAKVDSLERHAEIYDKYVDTMEMVTNWIIQQYQKQNELNNKEINQQRKGKAEKTQTDDQANACLEDLEKELSKKYEEYKAKVAIKEEDTKWYKWSKIMHFASYMEMIAQSHDSLKLKGIYETHSITPEMTYTDLASMLNTFKEYHPESAVLTETAKAYYKEVSKGQRSISGVMVGVIKDNLTHPVLQVGDIILTMKGIAVTNYEELKAANKKDGEQKMTFLRLTDGILTEHQANDCEPTDILGFIDLKQ